MVLKSAFAAVLCVTALTCGGAAMADEYRPDEFLRLDLPKAVLSPKRLGPESGFARVPIEARTDRVEADTDASVWPKLPARKTYVAKTHAEPSPVPVRAKLAKRHGNPLDAQARDVRIQTWPCRTGGICNWQR